MKTKFYKANRVCGSSVMFWRSNHYGYTSDISKAALYDRDKAMMEISSGKLRDAGEFFVAEDDVERYVTFRVDTQHVENSLLYPHSKSASDQYVAYLKNKFDGNHVLFIHEVIGYSADTVRAKIYSESEILAYKDCFDKMHIMPLHHQDLLEYMTFQVENLDKVECLGRTKKESSFIIVDDPLSE
jgi:hypothetical protein